MSSELRPPRCCEPLSTAMLAEIKTPVIKAHAVPPGSRCILGVTESANLHPARRGAAGRTALRRATRAVADPSTQGAPVLARRTPANRRLAGE